MTKRTTIAQCEAALRAQAGIPAHAAQTLGISRQAMCQRIDKSPRLQEAIREIEATLLDVARGNIAKALSAGDMTTTRWFAERKGAHLGFATKSQLVGKDGEPVDFDALLAQLSPDELAAVNALRARAGAGAETGTEPDS